MDGFSLRDKEDFYEIMEKGREDSWQAICEDMIWITNMIRDWEILNEDVRPANLMLRKICAHPGFEVVMLDFVECRIRDAHTSWEDWRIEKKDVAEEGAVRVSHGGKTERAIQVQTYQSLRSRF